MTSSNYVFEAGTILVYPGGGSAGVPVTLANFMTMTSKSVATLKEDFIGIETNNPSGSSSEAGYWDFDNNFYVLGMIGHPGIISHGAITDHHWGWLVGSNNANILLGGGTINLNWVVNTAILSDETNTYTLTIGLGSAGSVSGSITDGIYFTYTDSVNSGKWVINASASSATTSANTTTPVVPGWVNVGVTINASGTSAEFFINGVSQGAISTNIPVIGLIPFFQMIVNAGTIAQDSFLADLMYFTQNFTTSR